MGPTSNSGNESLQLPPPVEAPFEGGDVTPGGAERGRTSEGVAQASGQAAVAPSSIPLPTMPVLPVVNDQPAATSGVNQGNPAQAADDKDLIEKEWVRKAKQIVERTKDDPYKQSEELTVFKADYMKKRYNKTIKLTK